MQLPEIYEKMQNLDRLIDPLEINLIRGKISEFLIDFEQEDYELELKLSNTWLSIRETLLKGTDKQADRHLERTEDWKRSRQVKLLIKQLVRMRQDLKQRYEILTMTKPYLHQ